MKKIIKGKVYDTDTAQKVGEWCNHVGGFEYVSETLYRKKTGEYFLYGAGGAASKYSVESGQNQWSGGDKIIPLSYENAQEWSEERLEADEYISEFGNPGEGDVQLSVMISAQAKRALEIAAQKEGISQTAMVERVLLGISQV